MPVSKIGTNALSSGLDISSTNISYTGTLTGGTGVVNLGSGQFYKDASGNVGIGTSSPLARLHSTKAGAEVARFTNSQSNGGDWEFKIGGGGFEDRKLMITDKFGGADNVRVSIDSSGNLLVGTTSSGQVTSGWQAVSYANGWFQRISHTSAAASGDTYISFQYNAGGIGQITQNGTTGVTYGTTSDYRLKENVQPMTGALAKVAALKPVTYKWKTDGSDGQGFIAHELAEVCPDAVQGVKDAVDAEGNPIYQGIDTSFLVATLTAAIQELKAELDSVKAELAALKGA